jgi:hypothetical protein
VTAPFQKHSDTSRAAAQTAAHFAVTARERVWHFIRGGSGVSDRDIQRALSMNPSTERPRRVELLDAGLIRVCGEDPGPPRMNLYEVVPGKTYPADPGFWAALRAPSRKPSRKQLQALLVTMRRAYTMGVPFPPEAVEAMRWVARQVGPSNGT